MAHCLMHLVVGTSDAHQVSWVNLARCMEHASHLIECTRYAQIAHT